MARKRVKCWASVLGGCGGGQSREHYFTQGLYAGNVIVSGLPWAQGRSIDLPIGALASNILCGDHNEALSPVDGEAIRMKNFVVKAVEASSRDAPPRREYCSVDGRKIIRWLSKFICNVVTLGRRAPEPVYVRRAFAQPNAPVHVYVHKFFPVKDDADTSHIHFEEWIARLKSGGETALYILRFAIMEWLVAPLALTQYECNVLGHLTQGQHLFEAKPLDRTRKLWLGPRVSGNKTTFTHQLNLLIPRTRQT